jgi:DNA-binding MarR family transcriptional regulator
MNNILRNFALTMAEAGHAFKRFTVDLNLNISLEAIKVLFSVNYRPDVIQQEIAETLKKDKSAVLRLIDDLEKKGLVQRVVATNDRRRNIIHITENGKKLVAEIDSKLQELSAIFFNDLNNADIEAFNRVLEHIQSKAKTV